MFNELVKVKDQSNIGPTIKKIREEKNISIEQLARELDLTTKSIQRIENEGFTYVTASVQKLCKYFNIDYPKKTKKDSNVNKSNSYIDIDYIGEKFRETRRSLNLTIQNVSDELSIPSDIIYNIESGVNTNLDYILKLCNYYKINSDILELKDYETNVKLNILDDNVENIGNNNEGESMKDILNNHTNNLTYMNSFNKKNNSNIEELFYKKLTMDLPYIQIVKNMATSYGIIFNYIGYSSDGKISLYLPIEIKNTIDLNCIKKIKSEYLTFMDEFKNLESKDEKLEFIVCLISENPSKFIDFKEVLFNLFDNYKGIKVQSYSYSELADADDASCILQTS